MSKPRTRAVVGAAFAAVVGVGSLGAGPASAHMRQPSKVYVSPHAQASAHGGSCEHARVRSIQSAIETVRTGGTVVVCKGTYPGLVNVDRQVKLIGHRGATIDATGMAYGVGVSHSWVTVAGLTVKNASDTTTGPADGIITAAFGAEGPVPADHVRILHNVVTGNLGSGIDLNSTSYSVAAGNIAKDNGVGVNVADDLGAPATHNVIAFNIANRNFGGCGIALADHTGAGVTDNLVAHNVANDNGLSTPTAPDASAGSGVILASPVPGGIVRNNHIIGNRFAGNGHGGVVVHAHVPGGDFSGNVVSRNWIGTNNLRTDSYDMETTGIYIGSASPLSIVVSKNLIGPDHYGIFTAGDITVSGHNRYHHVAVHQDGVPAY